MAKKLADYAPNEPQWWISWAYATRRAQSIEAAKVFPIDAQKRHPDEAMIHYNLACYECRLRNLEMAKEHIGRARWD